MNASLLKAEARQVLKVRLSLVVMTVESSFPGEGSQERAPRRTGKESCGYHLPQISATVNSPVLQTMVFTGQRHYFTGQNMNEDYNVLMETKCPDTVLRA